MSTKIYDAFKVKDPRQLWPILWQIRDVARAEAQNALRDHYWKLVRSMEPTAEQRKDQGDRSEAIFRLRLARDLVRDAFKENSTSALKDTYALKMSVAVYPYKGNYYLRLFYDHSSVFGKVLDFVKDMSGLQDFHYQNQTDRPEEISARDWLNRKNTWYGLAALHKDIGNHVVLVITDWESFYHVDPWVDMVKEWRENPPAIPTRIEYWASELEKLKSVKRVTHTRNKIQVFPSRGHIILKGKRWYSVINKGRKPHKSLNHAADYLYFRHLPEDTQRMVETLMERNRGSVKV